jgi:hypothetical protein
MPGKLMVVAAVGPYHTGKRYDSVVVVGVFFFPPYVL